MHLELFEITLILLGACIAMSALLRRWQLPTLVGYLAVGAVLAPFANVIAEDKQRVEGLAEFGVVLLMFTLGLEFSLSKLASLRNYVFGLGPAQVLGTIGLVMLGEYLIPDGLLGSLLPGTFDWRTAVVLGGAVAMSSTALVSKMLQDNRELETDHGRRIFGILLFQDLAVIPLLVLIPALGGDADDWMKPMGIALLKAVVVLAILLKFGPRLMRFWFLQVARMRSHEIFTLNVLLAALFFAWLTESAGLSLELGAFMAGMLVSETQYRYQVEEDIKPFRDLLLGLFFVTIGIRLDTAYLMDAWPQVLVLLIVPVLLKFLVIFVFVLLFRGNSATAVRTGIWLAQAGEFAFVLLVLATNSGVLDARVLQPVLAAMLLSLLISPFLIRQAGRIALRFSHQEWLDRSLQLQKLATHALSKRSHIILCGFGRSGQALAHVLESESVSFVALDLDPDRVRLASAAGEQVVFGDATKRETLLAAGIMRASALVITYVDTASSLRVLAMVRSLAPQLPVLVRTANDRDLELLRANGATEVVPEIIEGSLVLASHALALSGVPLLRVQRRMRAIREERYQLLSGHFPAADEVQGETIDENPRLLHTVTVAPGSAMIGAPVAGLMAKDEPGAGVAGARLTALVRAGKRIVDIGPELMLQSGDTLVLAGTADQLEEAEGRLLRR